MKRSEIPNPRFQIPIGRTHGILREVECSKLELGIWILEFEFFPC